MLSAGRLIAPVVELPFVRRTIVTLEAAQKIAPVTSEDLVISRLCRQMLPPLLRADARRQKRLNRQTTRHPSPNADPGKAPGATVNKGE